MNLKYLIFILCFLCCHNIYGIAITWTGGAATTSWHDAANWDCSCIPTIVDNVTIGVAATVNISTPATANSVNVLIGSTLNINNTLDINNSSVSRSIENLGTINNYSSLTIQNSSIGIYNAALFNNYGKLNIANTVLTCFENISGATFTNKPCATFTFHTFFLCPGSFINEGWVYNNNTVPFSTFGGSSTNSGVIQDNNNSFGGSWFSGANNQGILIRKQSAQFCANELVTNIFRGARTDLSIVGGFAYDISNPAVSVGTIDLAMNTLQLSSPSANLTSLFFKANDITSSCTNEFTIKIDIPILPILPWFLDNDNDGFGVNATMVMACTPPPNHVGQGGDCNDMNAQINPNALEKCDGIDDDCDGIADAGTPQTNTFINTLSNNKWKDNVNWSLGIRPNLCHNVVVPTPHSVDVAIGQARSIDIQSGGALLGIADTKLFIEGDVNATFGLRNAENFIFGGNLQIKKILAPFATGIVNNGTIFLSNTATVNVENMGPNSTGIHNIGSYTDNSNLSVINTHIGLKNDSIYRMQRNAIFFNIGDNAIVNNKILEVISIANVGALSVGGNLYSGNSNSIINNYATWFLNNSSQMAGCVVNLQGGTFNNYGLISMPNAGIQGNSVNGICTSLGTVYNNLGTTNFYGHINLLVGALVNTGNLIFH